MQVDKNEKINALRIQNPRSLCNTCHVAYLGCIAKEYYGILTDFLESMK